MLTTCAGCDHELWSEVDARSALFAMVHFDDERGGTRRAEHAPSCPGCGALLDWVLPATPAIRQAAGRSYGGLAGLATR